MAPHTIRESVLTNAHARIIDRILVLRRNDDLLVVTSPNLEERVIGWLHGHIFFQDDVKVSMMETGWTSWGIYGPEAPYVATSTFPDLELPVGDEITSDPSVILWKVKSPKAGFRLLLDPADSEKFEKLATKENGHSIADHVYEILRIQSGVPQSPNEINENYIPLELGLWDAVSFSKGCYTGQEIIARMESRGKLARQLVGIQLSDEAPIGSLINHQRRKLGELSSVTFSPHNGWIGLSVVKPFTEGENDRSVTVGPDQVEARFVEFVDA
jgi:aminomethyltransferase